MKAEQEVEAQEQKLQTVVTEVAKDRDHIEKAIPNQLKDTGGTLYKSLDVSSGRYVFSKQSKCRVQSKSLGKATSTGMPAIAVSLRYYGFILENYSREPPPHPKGACLLLIDQRSSLVPGTCRNCLINRPLMDKS